MRSAEKSSIGLQEGKYTFKVAKKATKVQIAQAVEKLFNVKVKEVEVTVNPIDANNVIGHKKENILMQQGLL